METVQHAIGDLRVGPIERGRRGGRRGQGRHVENKEIKVPTTDFDFQSSNAKFNKTSAAPRKARDGDDETNPSDEEHSKEKESETKSYNPQSSFFDSLSSGSESPRSGNGSGGKGGRQGGGLGGRNRREEGREKNVATFGESSVVFMGPAIDRLSYPLRAIARRM